MDICADMKRRLQQHFTGSVEVEAVDVSSAKFKVSIVSEQFRGVPLIERHRQVQQVFSEDLLNGTIHALEIIAKPPPQ
jgi:stress-induced morphogen